MSDLKSSNPVFSLRAAFARFRADERGNIAVIFAITLLPMLGLVGAAIDYTRANNARTALQSALDTTALMISKDAASLPANQVQARAQQYFNALYTHTEAPVSNFTANYTANTGSGSSVVVTANSTIQTDFIKVLGSQFNQLGLNGASTTKWGSTKLRVALALDNTGSMQDNGKIGALRTAATNLVNQLSASATNDGDVLISLVPFSKDVNVGTSNVGASWIRWSGESDTWEENNGSCSNSYYNDKTSCQQAGKTWTAKSHSKWTGCVMDRDQDYDINGTAPNSSNAATLFPAEEYFENNETYCKPGNNPPLQEVMALSSDWTTLKNNIAAMQPTGGTNQAIGLAWGWLSLMQSDPLNAPSEDPKYQYSHIIILLSDGLNTEDRWPNYGNGVTQYTCSPGNALCIDARQKKLCDNIKAVKDAKNASVYTIYAIQVNTGSDPTSSVLQYCATDSSKFFVLTSANQIVTTFDSIGTQLAKLRISQ
ncbi:MAG: pilus assembly protein [Xanthobacteraceae bacterium]|nr:pilus assembly protein [Xanthobacteraceae bacterium]